MGLKFLLTIWPKEGEPKIVRTVHLRLTEKTEYQKVNLEFQAKTDNYAVPIFNIFHTTTNYVTVSINSNSASAQNSWENLKKSETQKSA